MEFSVTNTSKSVLWDKRGSLQNSQTNPCIGFIYVYADRDVHRDAYKWGCVFPAWLNLYSYLRYAVLPPLADTEDKTVTA